MTRTIGLLVGREWSFPPAFIDEVNGRGLDVRAEYVKLGTPAARSIPPYDLILDRFSHQVPFYRSYLRHAAARGVPVINSPYAQDVQDRFYAASVAAKIGIRVPRTVMLPHRAYGPEIVHEESLRNLDYPLDWQAVLDYVGVPCILGEATIVDTAESWTCHSVEELLERYDASDRKLLVAREEVAWDYCVRCFAIGREEVVTLAYDPRQRRYETERPAIPTELREEIAASSLRLSLAFGYEFNAVDWGVRDGVPYAVEIINPVPELDVYSLTEPYFEELVRKIADLATRLAGPAVARTAGATAGAPDLAEELPSLAQQLPRSEV